MQRFAELQDVPAMVRLSASKRASYAKHSPVFWRPANSADEAQAKFFAKLINDRDHLCVVSIDDGICNGFAIGRLMQAPPVYEPGGRVCMIDDFAVVRDSLWGTVGRDLYRYVRTEAARRHAALTIIVCGKHDAAKGDMLRTNGTQVASEWHVQSLDDPHPNVD
ncbi:MAG: hypothetical protein AAGE65_01960 [Planctomycetota bacterium]